MTTGIGRRSPEGQQAQRERSRVRPLQRKYNLTPVEVEEMRIIQDQKCGACGEVKPLVVDHDHATGLVRELLCHLCNTQLHVLENVERLALLTAYLERHQKRP